MLLSGILLPLTFAPVWLKTVADCNPFNWAVDAVRALFAGDPGDDACGRRSSILARADRGLALLGGPVVRQERPLTFDLH